MYVAYDGLLISPSSMMSMPAPACLPTTKPTASPIRSRKASALTGTPSSFANIVLISDSGRGRLPVCVVRKRSVLRFIVDSLSGWS
jgi:hypothetical protein